jgi:hypothetical protein
MMSLHIVVLVSFSIFIFWKAGLSMVEKRQIRIFLPFFVAGVVLCANAAVAFYDDTGLFVNAGFAIGKAGIILGLVWLFILVRRVKCT